MKTKSISIPKWLHDKIKAEADKNGQKIQGLTEKILADYFKTIKNEKAK